MNTFFHYLNLKQFLATAATLALVVPAVKAESASLIINNLKNNMISIPMKSLNQCEEAGAELKASKRFKAGNNAWYFGYECIESK